MIKKTKILYTIFLFFPTILYAQVNYALRDQEIKRTLDAVEAKMQTTKEKNEYKPSELTNDLRLLFGNQVYATFGLQTGFINGNTLYHISFDNPYAVGGHGESELEWPVKNYLWGININLNYKLSAKPDERRVLSRFSFSWLNRLGSGYGKMKDSDWIENDIGYIDYIDDGVINDSAGWVTNHPGKDIYSETDVKWDEGYLIDLSYTYNFWPKQKWGIGPLFGYRYQRFGFSAYNLDEIGYGPYADPTHPKSYMTFKDTQGRKWGTYEVEHQLPYLGLSTELNHKDKLYLLFTFGYSDWVHIKDKDTHLYPTTDEELGMNYDMVSPGTFKGKAYLLDLQGDLQFLPNWLLSLSSSYVSVNTKGTTQQYQYLDGFLFGMSPPIDDKAKSKTWVINLAAKYIF